LLSRIHEKLGTAGFIISIVALVAALTGGAYAASGALTSKQKKEVQKIAQTEAKKVAKAGPQGPAGPKGDTGSQGAKGDNGAPGAKGDTGSQGVVGTPGAPGKEGSPWTAGGVLPTGQTLVGNWAYGLSGPEQSPLTASVSFGIPLAAAPTVHYVATEGEEAAACPGSATAPKAAAGQLCVYQGVAVNNPGTFNAGFTEATLANSGVTLFFNPIQEGATFKPSFMAGTWAVTAG
jgi:hypothetical protein